MLIDNSATLKPLVRLFLENDRNHDMKLDRQEVEAAGAGLDVLKNSFKGRRHQKNTITLSDLLKKSGLNQYAAGAERYFERADRRDYWNGFMKNVEEGKVTSKQASLYLAHKITQEAEKEASRLKTAENLLAASFPELDADDFAENAQKLASVKLDEAALARVFATFKSLFPDQESLSVVESTAGSRYLADFVLFTHSRKEFAHQLAGEGWSAKDIQEELLYRFSW